MTTRLEFPTQQAAQTAADEIHAKMIQVDKDYERSVKAGQTTAWAIPYQDRDANGNVIGTLWYVNIKDRGRKAAEPEDLPKLKPIIKPEVVIK